MPIDASSILFCIMVITFKMDTTRGETGPALLVTYIPDSSSSEIRKYSYCRIQITESGIPISNLTCTYSNVTVYFHSVDSDYQSDVLFFYEHISNTIFIETNHSLDAIRRWKPIHRGVASIYTRMTYDWLSKNLYWTDIRYGWIGIISPRADDQRMYRILLHENIQTPHGITLDPLQGFLFWTDIGRTIEIERSDLTGDDRKVLISTGLITPYSIVADVRTQKIFWIDDGRDTIESAQYDGTGRSLIKRLLYAALFDVKVFKNLIYVSDTAYKLFHVMDKNTGENHNVFTARNLIPFGITMYHPYVHPANSTGYCGKLQCSHICVSKKDGATCICKDGFILNADAKTCSEDSGPFHRGLVVSNSTSLCMADIHAISASGYNLTCFLQTVGITHFEFDIIRREIFLANNSGLYFTNVDQLTLRHLFAVSGNVSGLAFDWIDRTIYWTEVDTGKIYFVSRDRTISLEVLSALELPRNLLVLPLERLMLWVSGSSLYKIESSKLDGTDRRVVIQFSAISNPASMCFDQSSQRLYFVDDIYIKSCELSGSDVQKLSRAPSNTVSLYFYKGYLLLNYQPSFYSPSSIQSFEIKGLNLTEKSPSQFTSIGRITDMKVFDERIQPSQKGPCEELNGGCEQICIATGLANRVCQCQFGFQSDPFNENSCFSSPLSSNFLLVTDWTHDMIYQFSLDTNNVQALDIKKITDPTGVIYDHIRKKVIWGSSREQQILSININGSAEMPIFPTGDRYKTYPSRFAIDVSTGNIFYTAISVNESTNTRGGYIAVLTFGRRHKKLITELQRPTAIVLYPSKGLMFWTDQGSEPHIGRSAMDGQNITKVINTGVTWPNGLALDYKTDRLYWSDGHTDRVEASSLDGTNRMVIFVDSGAYMTDIGFDNAGNLYYIALNRAYITKLVISQSIQAVHLFEKPELGRLYDLDIYTVDNQPPQNVHCLYNNGNCSTFCLPTVYGRSCSCEDGESISEDGETCSTETTTSRTTASLTTKQTEATTGLPTTENITSNTSTASSKPGNDNVQTLIYIAAGSSAGFVALIGAIVLIIHILLRRKMSNSEPTTLGNVESELRPISGQSGFASTPIPSNTSDNDRSNPCYDYLTPLPDHNAQQ